MASPAGHEAAAPSRPPAATVTSGPTTRTSYPTSVGPAGPCRPAGPCDPAGPCGPPGPAGPVRPRKPRGPRSRPPEVLPRERVVLDVLTGVAALGVRIEAVPDAAVGGALPVSYHHSRESHMPATRKPAAAAVTIRAAGAALIVSHVPSNQFTAHEELPTRVGASRRSSGWLKSLREAEHVGHQRPARPLEVGRRPAPRPSVRPTAAPNGGTTRVLRRSGP